MVVGVAVCAVILASCGSPKYTYLKSSADNTFIRVPSTWTVYDEHQLLRVSDKSEESLAAFKARSWSVGFDASTKPTVDHVLGTSTHPSGLVQVRSLLPEERDGFSLASLRTLFLPFDPLAGEPQKDGRVEVLAANEVRRDAGLHGSDLLLNLKSADGSLMKWRQVALTDSLVSKVHVLVISCSAECYAANVGEIDNIVESWKVTER